MKKLMFAFIALGILLTACGGSKPTVNPSKPNEYIPAWYLTPPSDSEHLYAVGVGTSPDMQLAFEAGAQICRQEMITQLENETQAMIKRAVSQVGGGADAQINSVFESVSKSLAAEMMYGAKVTKKEPVQNAGVVKGYVLMQMPLDGYEQRLEQKLKEQKALMAKVEGERLFDELKNEIENFKSNR